MTQQALFGAADVMPDLSRLLPGEHRCDDCGHGCGSPTHHTRCCGIGHPCASHPCDDCKRTKPFRPPVVDPGNCEQCTAPLTVEDTAGGQLRCRACDPVGDHYALPPTIGGPCVRCQPGGTT